MKNFFKNIILIGAVMVMSQIQSQIPIKKNHPSQILIKRYSALGDVPLEYFGKNDLGQIKSNKYLNHNDNNIMKIHKWYIEMPSTDTNSTNSIIKHKLNYLSRGITTINYDKPKEFIYQSVSEDARMWINWREKIISDPFSNRNNAKKKDFQFLDEFSLRGIINKNIFISTRFSMYRHSGRHIWISNDYNNEWVKYFPAIDMNFWYTNQTSFYIKNRLLDIEIANNPFSWGWSSGKSPIIAAEETTHRVAASHGRADITTSR